MTSIYMRNIVLLSPFPAHHQTAFTKALMPPYPYIWQRHFVRTVVLNDSCGARFIMKSGIKFMLLKGAKEDDPVFLVHREAHEPLGDVFFCTGLRGSSGKHYSLKVELSFNSYSITGATVIDLRFREREYWKHNFLLLPTRGVFANWQVDVHFSVDSFESTVRDSNDN